MMIDLDSVWKNETTVDGVMSEQSFDARGSGVIGVGNDGDEGGGSKLNLDIHGDDNRVAGVQRNGSANVWSAHTATVYIYANDNDVWINQNTDGAKTLTMTSRTDENNVNVEQTGYAAHTATVTLTGTNPTTLNLTQQSNTAQSYSLTQNCVTIGGCSVSVTQGQ